ncbi:SUN domain-containing 1 isoform X1 [Chlorella sorokiniana]|uniref:SUN domain-containing 1 isoform X1 n=1 Tax=Chlorella sorokiniana TaxID=3076 RepID=A0A2P6TQI9_CHLSO|nr:SUN domain-containing 1 isoform X1 [Chlorella sorokiniana]|eukprot:PRW56293.1 SUN domain-containing 1 isoform X1 [Chlorella sorokiniana]
MAPAGPLYSPRAVESALAMAAAALASKNAALDDLSARLDTLSIPQPGQSHAATDQGLQPARAPATDDDSKGQPAAAAELASVRQRLAAAEELLAAERSQRLAVKAQLEAVKRQLTEAVAAQCHAAAELGELEGLIQEMRSENQQLQATLTQRETAYLTLLETVHQLFVEHSPGGSGGGSSPAKLGQGAAHAAGKPQDADVGARLQYKLQDSIF